jgi:hypothetical protein
MASEPARLLFLSDGLLEQLLSCQTHGTGLTAVSSSCRRLNELVHVHQLTLRWPAHAWCPLSCILLKITAATCAVAALWCF